MKKLLILVFTLVSGQAFGQTSSISNGNWSISGNWTSGVPDKDESVTITDNMDLDTDIEVDNGGVYQIINGTVNDNGGVYRPVNTRQRKHGYRWQCDFAGRPKP